MFVLFPSFALISLVNCTAAIGIDHVEFNLCRAGLHDAMGIWGCLANYTGRSGYVLMNIYYDKPEIGWDCTS